ncbi:hypothetical protein GGI20_003756 [Coemansia sp. BCRC 34301]|nr:hypothetical protein GGI20_003756 [Coemansia sp. BCRC 34301]
MFLPTEILRKIISYINCPTQLERYATQFSHDDVCNLIAPLLSVSGVLRTLVLERACAKCGIMINDDSDKSLVTFKCWPKSKRLPHASTLTTYTRQVSVKVDFCDILNGDACEILENATWIASAFPNAIMLNILISGGGIGDNFYALETKQQNMIRFAQSIKRMLPRTNAVKVKLDNAMSFTEKSQTTSKLVNSLAEMLYCDSRKKRCMKAYYNVFEIGVLPNCVTDLTHVTTSVLHDSRATMMLLHKNTRSLQSLEVKFHSTAHLPNLVSDYVGNAIEYPNLHKLVMTEWTHGFPCRKSSTRHAHIPFPQLKLLSIDMEYPFSDETLFKGNSCTLESLKITLDPITVDMLRESDTFAHGQYAKLRNVCVKSLDPFSEVQTTTDYIYTSFVLKMSPKLHIFTDNGVLMGHNKLRFFHNCSNLTDLRMLNLPEMTIHMSSLVPLLKSLGRLESIECKFITDDLGISADDMLSTFNPLSARLKFVSLTGYEDVCNSVFNSIVLLALVCPALMRCYMLHDWRERLNAFVDSALEAMPSALHRDRLSAIKYVDYVEE